jgi:hypothetical protein
MNLRVLAHMLGGEISGNQVLAPGPGHGAEDRSLCVRLSPDSPDGFLVHSFADDDALKCRDHVRSRLGLPPWKPRTNGRGATEKLKRIVARYPYVDESGALLYEMVRYQPKDFRLRRPNGSGDWVWKLGDTRRVLYKLPELLQFPHGTVFVCEGEKDADRVASLGHCATTVASGVWKDVDIGALRTRDIFILQDNDEAGRTKALAAAKALHGTAATIRIVRLLGAKDVSDWLDLDPDNAGKLVPLCVDTPLWAPEATESEQQAAPFVTVSAADWANRPVPERRWLVLDRIVRGNVGILSGNGGVGKTTLALQLAVGVARGFAWLNAVVEEPGPVRRCAAGSARQRHHQADAATRPAQRARRRSQGRAGDPRSRCRSVRWK